MYYLLTVKKKERKKGPAEKLQQNQFTYFYRYIYVHIHRKFSPHSRHMNACVHTRIHTHSFKLAVQSCDMQNLWNFQDHDLW